MIVVCALGAFPGAAAAQDASAWLDAAASSARPPAGVVGSTTLYGLFGGRLRLDTRDAGGFDLFARGGRGGGPDPANWTEGEAGWEIGRANRHIAWGARTTVFGLSYAQPFQYRAYGGTLEPRVSMGAGRSVLALRGDLRRGGWRLTLPATDSSSAPSGTLAVSGGALSLARAVGGAWLEAGAEGYHGAYDGWFSGGFASGTLSRGPVDVGVTARAWSTPIGSEVGVAGSLTFAASDAASVRLEIGRSMTDPLYGTPGSLGASIGVALRLASVDASWRRSPVVELGAGGPAGRRARFRLRAPQAHTVGLAGDFTGWRPRTMERNGEDWTVELTIPAGLHHFAFLVDGREWRVPADAPGVSADEWGRKNATLVVEP
ncbi:MAG TPA: glycogen-binding domain-containing protein [Longimicrobiales bacterium]